MTCFIEEFKDAYSELLSVFREDDVNALISLQARFPHSLITSVDKEGNTLLHHAIYQKSEKIFDYLLTVEDAPIDTDNFNGVSPFILAFTEKARDFTLKLIKRGCDIDKEIKNKSGVFRYHTSPAIHCAIELEWYEVTEALIERGSDINIQSLYGETPLYVACKKRLVDEVFMLLFYGADARCTVAGSSVNILNLLAHYEDASIQDLYFRFVAQTNTVHLKTIVRAMTEDVPNFSKLLQVTKHLNYESSDLKSHICKKFAYFPPNYFKMFFEKFGDVVEDAIVEIGANWFCPCDFPFGIGGSRHRFGYDVDLFHQYAENLFQLLNSHLSFHFVENHLPSIRRLDDRNYVGNFNSHDNMITCLMLEATQKKSENKLEIVTRLICCLLSHGANLTSVAMDLLFKRYGHCDFFKMLLHMRIEDSSVKENRCRSIGQRSIVSRLIYDVHMSIERYLDHLLPLPHYHQSTTDRILSLIRLCDYSALPKMKQHCLPDDSFHRGLVERMKKLPNVPSLVEFARNSARAFIIKRFETKNSSQFYTILRKLPISETHRKIIAYETKLYPV